MFEESNKLYNNLPAYFTNDVKLFHVNNLIIPFSTEWQTIGVNLSGGADSASLVLILANLIKNYNLNCKIEIVNYIRCWNTRPWQKPVATNVYNKLKTMFPDVVGERYQTYIPPELEMGAGSNINGRSGDQIIGSSFNFYISYTNKWSAIFNATSQNPLDENFPNRLAKRDKNAKDGVISDLIYRKEKIYFVHPYRFVQKDWIIAQYYLHNALDLLYTTRSCEMSLGETESIKTLFPSLDAYNNQTDSLPECGSCFWCLERNWAHGKVGDNIDIIKDKYGS